MRHCKRFSALTRMPARSSPDPVVYGSFIYGKGDKHDLTPGERAEWRRVAREIENE